MIKKVLFFIGLWIGLTANAQIKSTEFRSKKFTLVKDTIQLDSVTINSQRFKVFDTTNRLIPSKEYQINFNLAQLIISSKKYPTVRVEYFRLPSFLTKVYQSFDEKQIVPNTTNNLIYSSATNRKNTQNIFFNAIDTKGNITRGLSIGNNQNAVVNSSLDITLEGKLSKEISLKAHIFDTNIPLQNNGYSQQITDFDRIFIEFEHEKWRVKAGDLQLSNTSSYFMPFTKQVSGLEVEASISKKLKGFASGAIVRGKFGVFRFTGREGNQGPYKIIGPNNEAFIVIVEGSESLFLNGRLLERGVNKDYTIDYTNSEIRFSTTLPITNDMRFYLEYQYSNNNYTRFISYEAANYKDEHWDINGYMYHENDVKSQPIQQALTDAQKQLLANAGNDPSNMNTNSAYRVTYSENSISYKKVMVGAEVTYKYSSDPSDEHYLVTFTNVGVNNGDYSIDRSIALGTIYSYVGKNLGNFSPIIQLVAPEKSQVIAVNAHYKNQKTSLFSEVALSNHDLNLFSTLDDSQNKGVATKLRWNQTLLDSQWKLTSDVGYEFIHKNFKSLQRFQTVEFDRDWNLINPVGNRSIFNVALNLSKSKTSFVKYGLDFMKYSENYSGTKHHFSSKTSFSSTTFKTNFSLLKNTSTLSENSFLRGFIGVEKSFKKAWAGTAINLEDNTLKNNQTNQFNLRSHRFKDYEAYIGVGDSTKIHATIGFNYRENDSIKNNSFTKINARKTLYLKSTLLQNKQALLQIFANYRVTDNVFSEDEKSLNSKVQYRQQLFNQLLQLQTAYETSTGNIPRLDYVYVETEPGQGYYTWIDYNNNGIKELNEFEIAIFKDQATYLRVALPNLNFINTQRVKISQAVTLNPSQWKTKSGLRRMISHLYNQTNFSVFNEQLRNEHSFNFNPFDINEASLVGLNATFKNQLFFNRNLKNYSLIFTYASSKNRQLFSIGSQELSSRFHQLELIHQLGKFWVFQLQSNRAKDALETENFQNQNYRLSRVEIAPTISFEYSKSHQFSLFYSWKQKKNQMANFEILQQQQLGSSYFYTSPKNTVLRGELSMYLNDFNGTTNTPVAYQMLEGLQPGRNITWSVVFQKKINSFMNINLNYMGRKGKQSRAIHTGSIQLRADF